MRVAIAAATPADVRDSAALSRLVHADDTPG